MKVIFVGPMKMRIPSEMGAIEEIIWRISQELRKRDLEVFIFNPISMSSLSRSVKGTALSFSLQKKSNIILHFHDLIACTSFTSTNRGSSVTLLSFHYPPWITKSRERSLIMNIILRYLRKRHVFFAAPSRAIVEWLKTKIDADVHFLPHGVDTSLFNPSRKNLELREKLLGDKEVLMCYVARIHPDKNHFDLLRAVKKLIYSGIKDFKLLLIGSYHGEFKNEKKSSSSYFMLLRHYIARWNLENYVEFVGELPRRTVATYLATSDIYVHPSKVEASIPLAIMEAMASGLPVVAYDLPYYREFLENFKNVIIVEPNNVNGLSEILATLISQPSLRKQLGVQARTFVEKYLDWEKIVERYYIPVYRRLIEDVSE